MISNLEALLFDLDGTLSDTDALHHQAYAETILEYQPTFNDGKPISRQFYNESMSGLSNLSIVWEHWPYLSREEGRALYRAKERRYGELIAGGLTPLRGLAELLDFVDRKGRKRALVTNAPRDMCRATLSSLGPNIENRFDHDNIILAELCEKPKPDPAPYLRALQVLSVDSKSAIAFEDSPTGTRAAVQAGILTVGILTSRTEEELTGEGAAFCVPHFAASQLAEALSLWIS